MTSQGRGKRSMASEAGVTPTQSHAKDNSANRTANCEEIRLRAYEIYLERGSLAGSELDDWLQAEQELDGRAPRKRESTDTEEH